MAPFALAAALVVLLAAALSALWPFTVDDTFITLRYARELAAGHGPVFQIGLPRAEGSTSPLWMTVLAIPHLVRIDALAFAKALGVVLAFGWIAFAARSAQAGAAGARHAGIAAAVAGAALAALPMTAVHAVSGMETMAYAFALLVLGDACARAVTGRGGTGAIAPLALIAGLLRPEGALIGLVAIVVTLASLPSASRPALLRSAMTGWLLPGALYFAWRWSYYGQPLPLPFYVKMSSPGSLPGLFNLKRFVIVTAPILLLAAKPLLTRSPGALPWAAIAAAQIGFAIFPEPIMGYHLRYLFPAVGPLAVLAGIGTARGFDEAADRAPALANRALLVGFLAVAFVMIPAARLRATIEDRLYYAHGLASAHIALGDRLAALPAGTIALSDCGAIPYRSGWRTIDLVGLNDAVIARTRDRSPASVFARNPDVLVLASRDSADFQPFFWNPWEAALLEGGIERGFVPVTRYRFNPSYWLWVLTRADDPRGAQLRSPAPPTATLSAPRSAAPGRRRG
jgi:hypothetical protein